MEADFKFLAFTLTMFNLLCLTLNSCQGHSNVLFTVTLILFICYVQLALSAFLQHNCIHFLHEDQGEGE